ncbi:MAG: trehalose-phosphatase [Candidatus Dormiibacterota bacterium]
MSPDGTAAGAQGPHGSLGLAPYLSRLDGTDPAHWLIGFDFDGTLAAIAAQPEDVVLDLDLEPVLEKLRARVGWLIVISGRERSLLSSLLPPGWLAIGSYGLELPPDLSQTGHPEGFDPVSATAALERALDQLRELSSELPGTLVEVKRWGVVLHYRAVPAVAEDRAHWRRFRAIAFGLGLAAVEGRQNYEMKAEGAPDKGWVLGRLVEVLTPSAVTFTGDDLGDVPAWDKLRQLSGELPTLSVGVGSTEAPEVMASVCDLVLPGRDQVRPFCEALLEKAGG